MNAAGMPSLLPVAAPAVAAESPGVAVDSTDAGAFMALLVQAMPLPVPPDTSLPMILLEIDGGNLSLPLLEDAEWAPAVVTDTLPELQLDTAPVPVPAIALDGVGDEAPSMEFPGLVLSPGVPALATPVPPPEPATAPVRSPLPKPALARPQSPAASEGMTPSQKPKLQKRAAEIRVSREPASPIPMTRAHTEVPAEVNPLQVPPAAVLPEVAIPRVQAPAMQSIEAPETPVARPPSNERAPVAPAAPTLIPMPPLPWMDQRAPVLFPMPPMEPRAPMAPPTPTPQATPVPAPAAMAAMAQLAMVTPARPELRVLGEAPVLTVSKPADQESPSENPQVTIVDRTSPTLKALGLVLDGIIASGGGIRPAPERTATRTSRTEAEPTTPASDPEQAVVIKKLVVTASEEAPAPTRRQSAAAPVPAETIAASAPAAPPAGFDSAPRELGGRESVTTGDTARPAPLASPRKQFGAVPGHHVTLEVENGAEDRARIRVSVHGGVVRATVLSNAALGIRLSDHVDELRRALADRGFHDTTLTLQRAEPPAAAATLLEHEGEHPQSGGRNKNRDDNPYYGPRHKPADDRPRQQRRPEPEEE